MSTTTLLVLALGALTASREWYFHRVVQQLTEYARDTAVWDAEHLDPVLTAGRRTIPHLIRALSNEDPNVQRVACFALGCQGDAAKPAVPELVRLLSHDNFGVRSEAAIALGGIGASAQTALPSLANALEDSSIQVRFFAAESLRRIHGRPDIILPWLIAVVEAETNEEEARVTATEVLGEIGPEALSAIPALRKAQDCPSTELRWAVANALCKIEGTTVTIPEGN